jgi:hypothetical protein
MCMQASARCALLVVCSWKECLPAPPLAPPQHQQEQCSRSCMGCSWWSSCIWCGVGLPTHVCFLRAAAGACTPSTPPVYPHPPVWLTSPMSLCCCSSTDPSILAAVWGGAGGGSRASCRGRAAASRSCLQGLVQVKAGAGYLAAGAAGELLRWRCMAVLVGSLAGNIGPCSVTAAAPLRPPPPRPLRTCADAAWLIV